MQQKRTYFLASSRTRRIIGITTRALLRVLEDAVTVERVPARVDSAVAGVEDVHGANAAHIGGPRTLGWQLDSDDDETR